ncbi:hypothetical protein KXV22_001376 [Aspergillus fumigatus]|nr:hypothetical protein KXX45_000973 [Aspergillus fumigatus]KAH1280726.1 hypothetical protein KXX48_004262 [Aspergillus fumigatus]KAH1285343.1 hypothetical protein KXX30_000403 [Aspergillus fumigatus]KAH1335626.1 hypothetical protein KXX67_004128 [Aspergillus fumigatus]KAH1350708.1 hypothetical protein KXX63_003722 [Aspergillus fumigatus]
MTHPENSNVTIGWPEAEYENVAYFIESRLPAAKPRQNKTRKKPLRITMLRVRPVQNLQAYPIQVRNLRRAYMGDSKTPHSTEATMAAAPRRQPLFRRDTGSERGEAQTHGEATEDGTQMRQSEFAEPKGILLLCAAAEQPGPHGATVYYIVESLEMTEKRVNELGGSVIQAKTTESAHGSLMKFSDPEGKQFGCYEVVRR